MQSMRLVTVLAAAALAGGCASSGASTGADTGLTPIVSLTGGDDTGSVKRTGNFIATSAASSGLVSGGVAARVDGTVTVRQEGGRDDQYSVTIELNSQRGAEELLWTIVPGRCGNAGLPLTSPRQNPRIEVHDSGLARLTAEFRATMSSDQDYHVNLYANDGTELSDVVACAYLRY